MTSLADLGRKSFGGLVRSTAKIYRLEPAKLANKTVKAARRSRRKVVARAKAARRPFAEKVMGSIRLAV